MPPSQKFRRQNKAKSKRGTRKDQVVQQIPNFAASRVGDIGDDDQHLPDTLDDTVLDEEFEVQEVLEVSSEEEDNAAAARSYASLLKTLKRSEHREDRSHKKRKLDNHDDDKTTPDGQLASNSVGGSNTNMPVEEEGFVDDGNDVEVADDESDSEDDSAAVLDPFEKRFTNLQEEELAKAIEERDQKPSIVKKLLGRNIRKIRYSENLQAPKSKGQVDFALKRKLKSIGDNLLANLEGEELDLAMEIFAYRDILCGFRTPTNSAHLRQMISLHVLNHMLKTRDRVLKTNAKLSQDSTSDGEYRDQGFTRPKVLILLPTKQSCVGWVETLISLSEPDQQENKSRFLEHYSLPHDDTFDDRPEDFKELFSGNHEEDFRIGLKFTRKTIKFFSGFYNSDIILASPLGLMRTIKSGSSNSKDESKKGHDADFLSSIEICVIDQATALEQQNWSHVDYIFSQLNQIPRESHGCDFARVRHFYLNDQSKYLRQVLLFAAYITPSIQSLATSHMHNISGRARYTPTYTGAMLDLSPTMPMTITQTFLRFESPSPHNDNDARFKYFTTTILSQLLRSTSKASNRGTLVFVPTYLDFVRLRNHFATASETNALSFGTISEYSSRGEVARTRSHFRSGKHSMVLYTERSHHYFRYKLKGVRRVIFYGVPENPIFWTELIAMLGTNAMDDVEWARNLRGKQGKGLVRAMFSKWDYMKLERVVGTDRVARLVSDSQGEVFEFV